MLHKGDQGILVIVLSGRVSVRRKAMAAALRCPRRLLKEQDLSTPGWDLGALQSSPHPTNTPGVIAPDTDAVPER